MARAWLRPERSRALHRARVGFKQWSELLQPMFRRLIASGLVICFATAARNASCWIRVRRIVDYALHIFVARLALQNSLGFLFKPAHFHFITAAASMTGFEQLIQCLRLSMGREAMGSASTIGTPCRGINSPADVLALRVRRRNPRTASRNWSRSMHAVSSNDIDHRRRSKQRLDTLEQLDHAVAPIDIIDKDRDGRLIARTSLSNSFTIGRNGSALDCM